MNRRNFVQTSGLGGLLACVADKTLAFVNEKKTTPGATSVKTDIYRLKLQHTWTTTMSSSTYRDILYVHYNYDGISGAGECAPRGVTVKDGQLILPSRPGLGLLSA